MPPVVALDFYEPDGSTLIGTLDDSQLVACESRPALYELGALRFVVSRHLAEASAALLAKGNYVKYRVPSVSEDPIALFVLKDDLSVLIDKAEKGAEHLEVRGPGGLWILQFARLREEVYAPAQPTRGDWDDDVSWNWRNRNYGAIFVRAIEEGQNQPGTPLGAITIDFDRDVDSDGVPWAVIAADFSVPIGTDVLSLADRLAAAGDFYPVLTPDMVLHAYQTYGRDLTGAFAADNVRFEKSVNIQTELKRNRTLDRVTHLITRDLDAVYRTYVTPDAFDQAVYAFLDISWTNDADQVEKTALNLLAASNDAAELYVFETSPGFVPASGEYMPGPVGTDGHFWPGDRSTLHTGTGEHDLNAADTRVTAVSLVLDTAADGSTDARAARSLHIVPELVIGIPRPQFSGVGDSPGAQGIACLCLRLCDPTILGDPDTELYHLHFTAGQETVAIYPSGTALWPITAARWESGAGSDGVAGHVRYTLAGTGAGSPKLPATAGVEYQVTIDTKYAGGIDLRFYNSSNAQLSSTRIVTHLEGNIWVLDRVGSAVAPATTAYMQIVCISAGYYDHVRIVALGSGTDTENPYAGIERRAARCDHSHPAAEHDHDADYSPLGHSHLFGELADALDASPPPDDGDVWIYDAASDTWQPGPVSGVTLSDDTPLIESGSGDPGVSTEASRSDHEHPDDGDTSGGGGGGGGGVSILSPASDTYIDSQNVTTNNDASTTVVVGNAWGSASFTRFALLSFDISALAGLDIAVAVLHLYRTDSNAAQATDRWLEARRVLRDYHPTQVTWNEYSTGNGWTTVGARDVGTDIELARTRGDRVGAAADIDQWHRVDVAPLLQAALDASETEFRIVIGANINGAGSNAVAFAALEHATAAIRPKLRVAHS